MNWVSENELYALIGLAVNLEDTSPGQTAPDLWAFTDNEFEIPSHWKEWLGRFRVEDVEGSNLFLVCKIEKPQGTYDRSFRLAQRRVMNFYSGLLLSSKFSPAEQPFLFAGERTNGEVLINRWEEIRQPVECYPSPYPEIPKGSINQAANIAQNLNEIWTGEPPTRDILRLARVATIYSNARCMDDPLDRIHQYVRCLEGFIVPKIGNTKKDFMKRTGLFIGEGHTQRMGEIYYIRSKVEHLKEVQFLEVSNLEIKPEVLEKEVVIEKAARETLEHIICRKGLWKHFGNEEALECFWRLPDDERKDIWGQPADWEMKMNEVK